MNTKGLFNLVVSLIISCSSLSALADNQSNWQCIAHDKTNKEWSASGSFQRSAINKAFEDCKKESQYPTTCKTSNSACESSVNGISTSPMWRCTAIDQLATKWTGNLYSHPDDAALGAKAYCQDRSVLPETCYVYLFMCKNMTALLADVPLS